MIKDFIPFIMLGCISYFIDITTAQKGYYSKCSSNMKVQLELLLHHILIMFSLFGWLSNSRSVLKVYILAPFLVISHWGTNNNKCYLSQRINEDCELDHNEQLRDPFEILGIKKYQWWNVFHKSYLLLTLYITICKLTV